MAELEVRYCTTTDGVRIAYGTLGDGFPVVFIPAWASHLEMDQIPPDPGPFTLIYYDKRGTGLSDRHLGDYSIETRLRDLEAVVQAAVGAGSLALYGNSEGGPVAVAYAAANPDRVSRLVLDGGFAVGDRNDKDRQTRAAVVALVKADWGMASAALDNIFWDANTQKELLDWWHRIEQEAVTAEDAAAMWEANGRIDVRDLLPSITCPTLVIHGRNDRAVPFDHGRELAAGIPGARLLSDDGGHKGDHPNRGAAVIQFLLGDEHVAGWRPETAAAPEPKPAPVAALDAGPGIRYAASADGTNIAYEVYGGGPGVPLVVVSAWWAITALGQFRKPIPVIEALYAGRPVVLYARRGIGASPRNIEDVSFERQVADLSAISEHLGVQSVDMLGVSDGASVALSFAARSPDRVRKLLLWGAFARGSDFMRPESASRLASMIRADWSLARRTMTTALGSSVPVAGNVLRDNAAMLRENMSQETAAKYVEAIAAVDVNDDLKNVHVPVLALHRRSDTHDPFAAGQSVAASLPNARFVAIDGDDPMWGQETELISDLMIEFLDGARPSSPATSPAAPDPVTDAPPRVRYARTKDGVSIAYATLGHGTACVWVPGFADTLERLWAGGQRRLIERYAEDFLVVRYDRAGLGLSDRHKRDSSLEGRLAELEAVVEDLQLDHFILRAMGDGCLTALAYAAANPQSVERLILLGGFASYQALGESRSELFEGVLALIRAEPAAAEAALTTLLGGEPGAFSPGEDWREHAINVIETGRPIDVASVLPLVVCPTLLVHGRHDKMVPLQLGRELAAALPNATLFIYEGDHYPRSPQAVTEVNKAVRQFVGLESSQWSMAAPPLPEHGTAVILFADIVDSTGLTERMGDSAFRERARELESRLRVAIEASGGSAVEGRTLGDGVLATFPAARQAIEAALRCSEEGDRANLPLHLGIHAGDITREGNDIHGGAVNVAARISALSEAGEVLVSDIVRGLGRTSADVIFEDRGEQSLKGVSDPVRVYAVLPREVARQKGLPDGLTAREAEVLRLIAQGRTNTEIAEELVLSVRTVARHITNVYGKIGARNKADATAYAGRNGLT